MKSKLKLKGYFLPLVLAIAAVVMIISSAIISLVHQNYFQAKRQDRQIGALNIAEAGVNYYLWHLSHDNKDYCDGNACSGAGPFGPYIHQYKDTAGATIGTFSLTITPPLPNASTVKIKAVGQLTASGDTRAVVASVGIPSFARYSFLTNSEAWFGDSEETHGLVHSNTGLHFDGLADGIIAATPATYTPSACFGGDGTTKAGVWGTGGPTSYWTYPVPRVDFNQVTSNLQELQTAASTGGLSLPAIPQSGYAIQLNANGTVLIGKVTAQLDSGQAGGSCVGHTRKTSLIQSIAWEATARALPTNGIIYVDDDAWVWGTVTSRLTIVSAHLPDTPASNTRIFLQNDITYSVKNGTVALGLISQNDILVNSNSENDLVIDAYLLSQKGKVFRPYYPGNVRTKISIYGGISSYSWWTWSWVNGAGTIISGYHTTSQTYDNFLALNPPPLFPTTGAFAILAWQEEPVF